MDSRRVTVALARPFSIATITVGQPSLIVTYSGTIRLYKMGFCLDDRNNSSSNGAVIQVWRCNGLPSQRWKVLSDGTIRHNGLCLDAAGYGVTDGTKVQLWACTGRTNQKWDTRNYRIHYDNPAATGEVLDDAGYGGNGTRQEIWTNNGTVKPTLGDQLTLALRVGPAVGAARQPCRVQVPGGREPGSPGLLVRAGQVTASAEARLA